MTSESLRKGSISQDTIKEALTKAQGDIFIAASYLHVATRELDRYIRSSDELQLYAGAIEQVKSNPNYEKLSNDQFKRELEHKTRSYKLDALEEVYKIATLTEHDLPEGVLLNGAMMDVKLKAAIKLMGDKSETPVNLEHQNILAELNNQYLSTAPRIKSVRAVQIEYDTEPQNLT